MLLGVVAEVAADPQHYSKPAHPAAYDQKYKSEYDLCDPRKAPKCAGKSNDTLCLKDSEYPSKEVKVSFEMQYKLEKSSVVQIT